MLAWTKLPDANRMIWTWSTLIYSMRLQSLRRRLLVNQYQSPHRPPHISTCHVKDNNHFNLPCSTCSLPCWMYSPFCSGVRFCTFFKDWARNSSKWHVTCDVWWRVTYDVWRVTCDLWRVTCDVRPNTVVTFVSQVNTPDYLSGMTVTGSCTPFTLLLLLSHDIIKRKSWIGTEREFFGKRNCVVKTCLLFIVALQCPRQPTQSSQQKHRKQQQRNDSPRRHRTHFDVEDNPLINSSMCCVTRDEIEIPQQLLQQKQQKQQQPTLSRNTTQLNPPEAPLHQIHISWKTIMLLTSVTCYVWRVTSDLVLTLLWNSDCRLSLRCR